MSTQLIYRGIAYQAQTQTVETIESKQLAQYRGLGYTVHHPIHVSPSKFQVLKYRGIAYSTGNATTPTSQLSQVPTGIVLAFN